MAIIGLILVGTALVVAEILFIPGIFVAGSIGIVLSGYGVYSSYQVYGNTTGTVTLILAILSNILAVYFSLRGNSWHAISLKDVNDSKVNDQRKLTFQVGDELKTISVLKPIGKVLFNGEEIEVKSSGEYIQEGKIVIVSKIDNNLIIVKEKQ